MPTSKKEYMKMTQKASPNSKKAKNLFHAFLIGGFICALGQALLILYNSLEIGEENAKLLVSVTLIVLTAVLTAFGVFDDIGKFAGAGTLVPITGFANSVVSPAMEFKSEGRIMGTGAEMFKIAGPVIVYGCSAAAVYGFIYWIAG